MRFHPFFGGDLETFIRCDLIVRVRFLAGRMFGGLVPTKSSNAAIATVGLLSARAVALWCIAVALRSDLAVAPITAEQRSEDRGAMSPFAAPRPFVAAAGRDRGIIAGQGVVPLRQAPRSVS